MNKKYMLIGCIILISFGFLGISIADTNKPLVDLKKFPSIVKASEYVDNLQVEMKYATNNNFLGKNVYGNFNQCYLQKDAAMMLAKTAKLLKKRDPELHIIAYDCLRPRSVQKLMWNAVKGTKEQNYVANPYSKTGSIHNYGCAIDLTLATKDNKPIDMGTPFDFFGKKAEPRHEIKMINHKQLKSKQLANRLLLREIMVRAGFYPINNEWWHFNCATPKETRTKYRIVE